MATYLQGVQDNVEKVQPPQPNLQFEAQLLQARQAKYDAGHKKLSDMYGKILNSGLTREDNIKARDDFFKLIDQDLKKVAGMDLSLESNVSKAQQVFSQVYENDYLVKDMVWTKNFQNEMRRADAFKNCVDPEKCGGEYWPDGVKAMQYKKQEFAETDNADSLAFGNVEYVPYNNMMEDAIKQAKEAGLNVTQDTISGDYKVTTKNGALLVTPLTDLFSKLYSKNPAYQQQFETQAYNARKDWASGQVQAGAFETMQEAEVGYITQRSEQLTAAVNQIAADIGADADMIDKQLQGLQDMMNNGQIFEGDANHQRYQELSSLKGLSDQANSFAETSKLAMKKANDHKTIRAIGAQLDQGSAIALMNSEIKGVANTLAYKDASQTLEADDFAKMRIKFGYDTALENLKHRNMIGREQWKSDHGHSSYAGDGKLPKSVANIIDKDFKGVNGSQEALKSIEADATLEYQDILTPTELSKISKNPDPNAPTYTEEELTTLELDDIQEGGMRRAFANQRNALLTQQKQSYITQRKASFLDNQYTDAGMESNYASNLKKYGPDMIFGNPSSSGGGGGGNSGSGNYGGGSVNAPHGGRLGNAPAPSGSGTPRPSGSGTPAPSGSGGGGRGGNTPIPTPGGGAGGDTPAPTRTPKVENTSTEGVADGEFTYNDTKYKKEGDTWYKDIKGKFVELTKGDVAKRSKVLEDNAKRTLTSADMAERMPEQGQPEFKYADITPKQWEDGIDNKTLQYVADNSADPGVKKYYQAIIKKGGVEYLKTRPQSEQDNLYSKVGRRIDKIKSHADGPTWEASEELVFGQKKGAEQFKELNDRVKGGRFGNAQKIADNYLMSVQEGSNEEQSLRNWMEKYLMQNGTIKHGELSYNGKVIGYVNKKHDDGGYSSMTSVANLKKGDGRRNSLVFKPNQQAGFLTREVMQDLIGNNEFLPDALVRHRIKDRLDGTQEGDYFTQPFGGSKLSQYEQDMKNYDENYEAHQGLRASKKEAHQKIMNSMNTSEVFKDDEWLTADKFVKDGYFVWPSGVVLPEQKKAIKEAYEDAMDETYVENGLNNYMVGVAGQQQRKMKVRDIDLSVAPEGSVAWDIRAHLKAAMKGDYDSNTVHMGSVGFDGNTVLKGKDNFDKNADILNGLLNGDYDISTVEYSSVGGRDPKRFDAVIAGEEYTQGSKDWSSMSIKTTDGQTIVVDLNNAIETNRTTLLTKSRNTPKGEMINITGQYTYNSGFDTKHLTNKKPIVIQRKNDSELSIQGRIFMWDSGTEQGIYKDIQRDLIDAGNMPGIMSPEGMEQWLDALLLTSQQEYEAHMPKAK